MTEQKQIPVYLFTGFLDCGKTTFIQGTLEDKRFNAGQRTLLIRCEDGEEEYDAGAFSAGNVFMKTLEAEEELQEELLLRWMKETDPERVIVEYNGMWPVQTLYDTMPDDWAVAQEIMFAEASTFTVFNANMRNLVFDKLKTCDVAVFNRCGEDSDTGAFHKIVRQVNRRCNIVYEYTDGRTVPDEQEDPLPFDLNAAVVTIEDRDYAYFFADLMENTENYQGKTVEFTAMCPESKKPLPANVTVAGRMLMNCCAADTQFAGIACYLKGIRKPAGGSWIRLRGKIRVKRNKLFSGEVPVMDVISIEPGTEPEDPVATFY